LRRIDMRIDRIAYPKSRRQDSKTLSRVWIFIILAALVAVPINLASSGRASKGTIASDIGNKATSSLLPWESPKTSPGLFPFLPQAGPTITTYKGDCTTPKSVFNRADTTPGALIVCAKVTGFDANQVVLWSNPDFIQKQSAPVGTGESTFTLTTTSGLGDWRVILYEPLGGAVYALKAFTVNDAGNPSADLAVSKSAVNSPVSAGSQAVFEVQVTNFGPNDVPNVEVLDSVPANTTFASYALVSGPSGINCVNPAVGGMGNTTCTIPILARGETAVFTATYDVAAGTLPGTLIANTASVSNTGIPAVEMPPTPAVPPIPDPRDANDAATATAVVTAAAAEACLLDCPANVVVTANTTQGGNPGAFVTFWAASVEGDCGAVTNSPASGSFFTVGTHSIISSSAAGPSCTFTVTVLDTAPPTITCPANLIYTAPSGATDFILPSGTGTPTINASGGGTVVGLRSDDDADPVTPPKPLTDAYPIGSTGILWTVTDAGGRTASCSQTITIVAAGDRDPVTITCPGNVTYPAPSGSCAATIPAATIGTPTTKPTTDVTVTARRSDDLPLSDPFPAGMTIITWTATDDLNGNVASCTQTVTVTVGGSGDTTPPTFTVVPQNVTTTTASCTATLDDELGTAEATDAGACSGSVTITRTGVPSNFVFPTGTTTVIYTATDAAGNSAQVVQLVTVTESPAVPPTITAPADVNANTGPGATICGVFVSDATLGAATANDNCPGVIVTRTGVPAGNIFPVGPTIVTYTATDASGNTAQDTQTVTVTDNTVPVVTAPPAVTLYTGPGATSCGVTVSDLNGTLGTGSATDNCPGVGAVTRSGVPAGNVFPLGNTTVTYSATDAHGNTGSANQIVTVVDNTPPQITCPAPITIEPTCPTGAIATWTPPVGTDNCPGATTTQTAGGALGSVFSIGTTTVTYSVTDANGNGPVTCSFTVTVLTPQAVIQNLQAAVNASSLTGTQKNGLLAKLSAALQGINGGQINVACNKLAEFNNSVGVLINNGSLSAATGNAWILSSNHVRNTIGCTNRQCS
jgi:uncharacterized repeat protein (TIGR01451 family)